MKNLTRVAIAILLVFTLCACGKKYSTIEEYYNSSEDFKKQIDQVASDSSSDGMVCSAEIKDNTVTLSYTIDIANAPGIGDTIKGEFDKQESQFVSYANDIKKDVGVDDCTIRILVNNNQGDVLCDVQYSSTNE